MASTNLRKRSISGHFLKEGIKSKSAERE